MVLFLISYLFVGVTLLTLKVNKYHYHYCFQIPEEKELEDAPDNSQNNSSSSIEPNKSENVLNNHEICNKNTEPESVLPLSEISLDDFEKRQKLIKEQNRQRKELLKKALEDRFVLFFFFF